MQCLYRQAIFLIVILSISIIPGPVNAQINDTFIHENIVDENTAYSIANSILKSYSEDSFGCENFSGSYVQKINKMNVYDVLSGELLYYEFDVMKKGEPIGNVRVAGNKLLGTLALSVGCKADLKENLTYYYDVLEKKGSSPLIISYGTYNALLIREKNETGINEYIYDVYSCEKIPLEKIRWSFFLSLDESAAQNNIEEWEKGYFSLVIVEDTEISGGNLSDGNLPKKTSAAGSPGFSGITAIIVFGLIIFVYRKFS